MLIFDILKHGSSTLSFNSSDNIARIIKCDISKSKLALSTCDGVYFSSTALIVFTLYEIKQVKIFLGHPVDYFLSCVINVLFESASFFWPRRRSYTYGVLGAVHMSLLNRASPSHAIV